MTNKEAIHKLKIFYATACEARDNDTAKVLKLAIKALEKDEWIPVSERPPKESLNSVIGWDAYREKSVFVQYLDGRFQITGSNESFKIVAWMPKPKPYKEEAENE